MASGPNCNGHFFEEKLIPTPKPAGTLYAHQSRRNGTAAQDDTLKGHQLRRDEIGAVLPHCAQPHPVGHQNTRALVAAMKKR